MGKKLKIKAARYGWNLLSALDQLLNTVTFGYPDETFSSRAWRKARAGQWPWKLTRAVIDAVFFWQPGHCRASYQSEQLRRHSPAELAD